MIFSLIWNCFIVVLAAKDLAVAVVELLVLLGLGVGVLDLVVEFV